MDEQKPNEYILEDNTRTIQQQSTLNKMLNVLGIRSREIMAFLDVENLNDEIIQLMDKIISLNDRDSIYRLLLDTYAAKKQLNFGSLNMDKVIESGLFENPVTDDFLHGQTEMANQFSNFKRTVVNIGSVKNLLQKDSFIFFEDVMQMDGSDESTEASEKIIQDIEAKNRVVYTGIEAKVLHKMNELGRMYQSLINAGLINRQRVPVEFFEVRMLGNDVKANKWQVYIHPTRIKTKMLEKLEILELHGKLDISQL